MQKTFTPAVCKAKDDGTAPLYAGSVTLRMPNYDERMGLYEDAGVDSAADIKSLKLVRSLAKRLPDFLVAVDITRLEDGHKFGDWESLQYDSDMAGVISECCLALITRVRAGN